MKTHVCTTWVALSHRLCPHRSAGSVAVDLCSNRRIELRRQLLVVWVGAEDVSTGAGKDGTASARWFPLTHGRSWRARPGWNERGGKGWGLIVWPSSDPLVGARKVYAGELWCVTPSCYGTTLGIFFFSSEVPRLWHLAASSTSGDVVLIPWKQQHPVPLFSPWGTLSWEPTEVGNAACVWLIALLKFRNARAELAADGRTKTMVAFFCFIYIRSTYLCAYEIHVYWWFAV